MSHDSDLYVFSADSLPADPRFLPPLANGLLGWRVYDGVMHMGGVYNGEGGRCHRADVPCPLAVEVKLEEPVQQEYALDARSGTPRRRRLLLRGASLSPPLQVFSPTR